MRTNSLIFQMRHPFHVTSAKVVQLHSGSNQAENILNKLKILQKLLCMWISRVSIFIMVQLEKKNINTKRVTKQQNQSHDMGVPRGYVT